MVFCTFGPRGGGRMVGEGVAVIPDTDCYKPFNVPLYSWISLNVSYPAKSTGSA